ncbi:hypothetical protein FN846DRAFT_934749, partial [Sphaerosporella brunnea]
MMMMMMMMMMACCSKSFFSLLILSHWYVHRRRGVVCPGFSSIVLGISICSRSGARVRFVPCGFLHLAVALSLWAEIER